MNPGAFVVGIRGSGAAASIAAHLLSKAGITVDRTCPATPSTGAAVMLGEQALHLLRDILGHSALFAEATPIERRVVLWGAGAETHTLPHPARVVTAAALEASLSAPRTNAPETGDAVFTIDASPSAAAGRLNFGRRSATATAVSLRPAADPASCLVESCAAGWLFLIPQGSRAAWLLAVGGDASAMLGDSRLVAPVVETVGATLATFETAPHMLEHLIGDDWLAIGSKAIAFDPLCGDGTAQAAREAILAAAVAREIADGRDSAPVLRHYRAMLIAAMRRHLATSLPFYRTGGSGPWWRDQAAGSADAYARCTALLAREPEPAFVLRGLRLHPREAAL